MTETTETNRKVNYSATLGISDNTIAEIIEAQQFVSAPSNSRVTVGNAPVEYEMNEDGVQVPKGSPYTVTFSWTEN